MNAPDAAFPVVAIAGLPRVGSMWTYNVARALSRAAGLDPIPARVPRQDAQMIAVADAYRKQPPPDTRCIIKVHALIDPSPDIVIIRNTRNLRDRLYSYYNFMKIDFDAERIARAVAASLHFDRHYDDWPAGRILDIAFDRIAAGERDVIREIAAFIGLPRPDDATVEEIGFRFSKQQVRRRIAMIEDRLLDADGRLREDADPDAVLSDGAGRVRAFDTDSGFQTGHVTDYRAGDWQRLWTERQKRMVDDAIRQAQLRDDDTAAT
jgi:hypothetical protein